MARFFDDNRKMEVRNAAGAGKPIPQKEGRTPLVDRKLSPEDQEKLNARLLICLRYLYVKELEVALKRGADPNIKTSDGSMTLLECVEESIRNVRSWAVQIDPETGRWQDDEQKYTIKQLEKIRELLRKHGAVE